ncbi:MAG: STAS domain-containing protein [Spirochaetota bacterium]
MIIQLREDLGIRNIKDFFSQIKTAVKDEGEITLDFSKMRRLDLSVIQVIMAANRELLKKGRKIILKSASKDVKKQLFICGFAKRL